MATSLPWILTASSSARASCFWSKDYHAVMEYGLWWARASVLTMHVWHPGGVPARPRGRWRRSARLTSTSAASPPRRHPAGTVPCAFNSAKQKIKSAVYANCIDFGKKMSALAWKISTLEGTTRMLDNLYSYDNELIRTEVRYQKHVSSPRGF